MEEYESIYTEPSSFKGFHVYSGGSADGEYLGHVDSSAEIEELL